MIDFKKDLNIFKDLLDERKKFSFSKYADGEYAFLRNQKITNCDNWTFDPTIHEKYQKKLLDSFKYNEDGYYVGISCPCCVPQNHVNWMRKTVNVPKDRLTWANIFVNGNHNDYIKNIVPLFVKYEVILIANEKAKICNLPFKIKEHIPITDLAWVDNYDLLESLPKRNDSDKLYLFAAGPLGNMLSYELWKNNKNNTYIDIGSTLNSYLVGNNRGYLRGAPTLNKICKW
jgi:hypothetical protein